MSNFVEFGKAVNAAYTSILEKDGGKKNRVFVVDIKGDDLWAAYLAAFPEGTNPMFRERREYECNTCHNFVRNLGAVVYAEKGKLLTVWDVELENPTYQIVADTLAKLVRSLPIKERFWAEMPSYGCEQTTSATTGEKWNHFHGDVPAIFRWNKNPSDYIGESTNDKNGLERSISEISDEAIEIVLDLINTDSLYKGPEKIKKVEMLQRLKAAYGKLKTERGREIFLWTESSEKTRVHSDVIGTLLLDITAGVELEVAVKKFEDKMAGGNYKRSKALVTQKMIDEAQKVVEKLDLEASLHRRHAKREDISVNDVEFVDGTVRKKLRGGAFEGIKPTAKAKVAAPKLDKIEDISIKDFMAKVLPKIDTMEMFVQNRHIPKLVSLLAPVYPDANPLFKWDNGFSWSYNGDVADSDIRRAVQEKGGRVDGVLRFSHSWNYGKRNASLMDLHVFMPGNPHKSGKHDNYGFERDRVGWNNRTDYRSGGSQDVDYTEAAPEGYVPVENITFPDLSKLKDGQYQCKIHNWRKREPNYGGFKAEIEFEGNVFEYEYDQPLDHKEWVDVATVTLKNGKFSIEHHLPHSASSTEVWGITTEQWTPVDLITRSPNFWNGQSIGNEHVFFILRGCLREGSTRGFYNEYLRDDLHKHRKVFEVVAGQMRAPFTEQQLSGLGFSTTQRNDIQVRVKGSMSRVFNIKF
uniref:Uncharacterized protein n=1 Tax=Pseudomonas phage HRDY3 TaxID=3236930 RepID=A0AB39CEE3_9VIRU